MGHHCAAFGCTNNSRKISCKERKVSFHGFPLNEPERLQKWLVNIRRKDFVPNTFTAICSEHFNEEDFIYKMFAGTRMLKKNAIPTKFSFHTVENERLNMEGRIKTQVQGKTDSETETEENRNRRERFSFSNKCCKTKSFKAFVGKTEKKCNKCGFVTFCLHVLYNHKYKCRGQLLGKPIFCSYCKRKFYFLTLYRTHKLTCVKKLERKKFLSSKLKEKHLRYKRKSKQTSSNKYSFSCPICHASFHTKYKFVSHLKQQNCTSQQTNEKISFSARKSCNSVKSSKISQSYENKKNSISKYEKHFYKSSNNKQFCCTWCKSLYPSEKLFFMHLGMNEQCATVYYQTLSSSIHKKTSLKAKKTLHVVARKTFSHKKQQIVEDDFKHKKAFSNRSARKSLTSSHRKGYGRVQTDVSNSFLNQCPVCFKDFPDTFSFFQHQKLMNHWGKATKSFTSSCRCPFCGKEFMHLKSRNAHVCSHTDRSDGEIKSFLKSCACKICSQIFASPLATQQHMKIEHHTQTSDNSVKWFGSGSEHNTASDNEYTSKHKMSSVPSSVKKKLKQQPNSCPVCSKAFSHTVLRNKHFNEVHLKIFECQYCNTKFKSTSSLFNHIQLSHGRNLECKECKSNFVNELQLLQHILKSHPNHDPKLLLPLKSLKNTISKEKSQDDMSEIGVRYIDKMPSINDTSKKNLEYYCDVCDIGYQKLCGLQRHRQSKFHKDTLEKNLDAFKKSLSDLPPSTPSYPRVVKQPEILTCSECSEDFTNIKDFVPHRLSHFSVQSKYLKINELNPYMCEICSDVLDSHSKVQLHLFWHLQIESTSNKNTNTVSSKSDTIVPDRLSGQHVAKKSFSKPSSESLQEVVIGGVKKPLFTCEACNIGFTTKAHYNMHVRKLCKKMKTSKQLSKSSNSEHEVSSRKSVGNSKSNVVHCSNCNCLYISPGKYEQHKEFCIKCCFDDSSDEALSNSDIIKSALNLNTAVAGCITCAAIFEDISCVAGHLTIHQEGDISLSDAVMEDVLHCALCNCLFALQAFKLHKDFCKIPVNFGSKVTYEKHINVLKSALELKCAVAACISCGVPFDDLETFSKHLTLHQTNQIQNESIDKTLCNGETADSAYNAESENSLVDSTTDFLIGDLTNSIESNHQERNPLSSPAKSLDFSQDYPSNSEANTSVLVDSKQGDEEDDINNLRKNFSELLCILIADPDLMQKLGYGEQLVDSVLINVLQQMGQTPCSEIVSDIDQLRKNIQIFLDLCLKDQVMQVIGKGKTTDEMVVEALKIFTSDESTLNDGN